MTQDKKKTNRAVTNRKKTKYLQDKYNFQFYEKKQNKNTYNFTNKYSSNSTKKKTKLLAIAETKNQTKTTKAIILPIG